MDKAAIYAYLQAQHLWHERREHPAIFTMQERAALDLPYPEANAKNLFVRDDKKRHYYLLTVQGHKRLDLKHFQHQAETRRLSFASADELMAILGLVQGAVTPLGLLNDRERRVSLYLDDAFLQPPQLIGVHPNDNSATVWLRSPDLIALIRAHGNPVHTFTL